MSTGIVVLGSPSAAWAQGTAAASTAPVVLVVGDSLSAEYGLARGQGWVALMAARVAAQKLPVRIVNASISGDTTAGGRTRLPALLASYKPKVVIIELGANDGLRGLPIATARDNLLAMARMARSIGAKTVIVGMQIPPNYGREYTSGFASMFPAVATQAGAALVPFFLAGVADAPDAKSLFQGDGIHPRAEAHSRLLDNVWPAVAPLLKG